MSENVFEYVIEANAFIDAARYLTLLLGFWVFCASLHRFLTHALHETAVAGMALGIFTSVQELTILGQPFHPWRLPLLIVMNVAIAVHLYRSVSRAG